MAYYVTTPKDQRVKEADAGWQTEKGGSGWRSGESLLQLGTSASSYSVAFPYSWINDSALSKGGKD